MEIVDSKKIKERERNVYIAYKNKTSRYLAYILYLNLRKCFNVFYDKATIEVSDAWKEILNTSLYKSNVCLIIGEDGAFESLTEGKQDNDEFLNEVSFAITKRQEKQLEILYLAVEGYKPWKDSTIEKISYIQNLEELQDYQGLKFVFDERNESQIKADIKEVISRCKKLCDRARLKSVSGISSYVGPKSKIQDSKMQEHF